jgi:hypothetical protein
LQEDLKTILTYVTKEKREDKHEDDVEDGHEDETEWEKKRNQAAR